MKHYTIEEKSAYFMKHIFSADVGSIVKISIYTFRKHIRKYNPILSYLIDNGFINIVDKGGFKKGTTIYRILKKWNKNTNITNLEYDIQNKQSSKRKQLCQYQNLTIDITDKEFIKASKQQQDLINIIRTNSIVIRQSANKTVWTAFSSLKKEYRQLVKQIDTNESLVEIDINASIPRLLPIYFQNHCKNWLDVYKEQINKDIEKYKTAIKMYPDAYTGLIEIMELDIDRDLFKDFFLKMIFGAGTKDGEHKLEIKQAFTKIFPGMSTQLTKFAELNRKSKDKVKSWKYTGFAGQIFGLQATIIEKTLKNLNFDKYSVFDSINVPASNVEQARTNLIEAWNNVTGESGLLGFKIDGTFYDMSSPKGSESFASSSSSSTQDTNSDFGRLRIESGSTKIEGRGWYHMSDTFALNRPKSILTDQNHSINVKIPKAEEGDEALARVAQNEAVSVANSLNRPKQTRTREVEIKQHGKKYRVRYKDNWIPSNKNETYDQFKKRLEEEYTDIKIKEN